MIDFNKHFTIEIVQDEENKLIVELEPISKRARTFLKQRHEKRSEDKINPGDRIKFEFSVTNAVQNFWYDFLNSDVHK
jgi:hypothetical protein